MIMTRQQKFIHAVFRKVGGATKTQLSALCAPIFCPDHPEKVANIVESAVKLFPMCNVNVHWDGDVCYLGSTRPQAGLLEAIDVMIELSGGTPLDYQKEVEPILLRFRIQEGMKVRLFAVVRYGENLSPCSLLHTERVIWLFDGQGHPQALPVSNKQFFAVRQENGQHRFFTP